MGEIIDIPGQVVSSKSKGAGRLNLDFWILFQDTGGKEERGRERGNALFPHADKVIRKKEFSINRKELPKQIRRKISDKSHFDNRYIGFCCE